MPTQNYYRDPTHLVDLANYLFAKEHSDRDFTFVINGDRVKVHKLIIRSVGSEQFQQKFKEWTANGSDKATVEIFSITGEPIDTKMFKLFIQYCYTGSLNWREISDHGLLDMMAICAAYEFHHLADVLVEGCDNRAYLNIWNVWYFHAAANQYGHQNLHDRCIKFIDRHAIEALTQDTATIIEPKLFKNIMSRDTLFAKELDILKGLMAYFAKNNENLSTEMKKSLLDTIRWTLVTKREFKELVESSGLMTEDDYAAIKLEKFEEPRYDRDKPKPIYPAGTYGPAPINPSY